MFGGWDRRGQAGHRPAAHARADAALELDQPFVHLAVGGEQFLVALFQLDELLALAGGLLLMVADIAARVLIAPQELPVGVLTAVLGGVYLLWRMHRGARSGGLK